MDAGARAWFGRPAPRSAWWVVVALAACTGDTPDPELLSDYRLVLEPHTLDDQDPFPAGSEVSLVITEPDGDQEVLFAGTTAADRALEQLLTYPEGTRVGLLVEEPGGDPSAWDVDRTVAYGEILLDVALGTDGDELSRGVLVTLVGEPGLLDLPGRGDERLFAGVAMVPGGEVFVFGGTNQARLGNNSPAATDTVFLLRDADEGERAFDKLDVTFPESDFATDAGPVTGTARAACSATWVREHDRDLILVAGGRRDAKTVDGNTDVALLFDPTTRDWLRDDQGDPVTLKLPTSRSEHVAVRLVNSNVLFVGGIEEEGFLPLDAWLYEANTRKFRTIDLQSAGIGLHRPVATSIGTDGALICGGADLSSGDQTDPWPALDGCVRMTLDGSLLPVADLPLPLVEQSMVQLADGRVLLTGGMADELVADFSPAAGASREAFVYDLAADTWTAAGTLAQARSGHAMIALPDGAALVLGGVEGSGALFHDTLSPVLCPERFDPSSGTFTRLTSCGSAGAGYNAVVTETPGDGAFVLEGWSLTRGGFDGSGSYGLVATGPLR